VAKIGGKKNLKKRFGTRVVGTAKSSFRTPQCKEVFWHLSRGGGGNGGIGAEPGKWFNIHTSAGGAAEVFGQAGGGQLTRKVLARGPWGSREGGTILAGNGGVF